MTVYAIIGVAGLVGAFFVWLALRHAENRGRAEERADTLENEDKLRDSARDARDNLSDADRLRLRGAKTDGK